jgi:hypothetical protein
MLTNKHNCDSLFLFLHCRSYTQRNVPLKTQCSSLNLPSHFPTKFCRHVQCPIQQLILLNLIIVISGVETYSEKSSFGSFLHYDVTSLLSCSALFSHIPSYLLPKTPMISLPPSPHWAFPNANKLSRGHKHELICHLNDELLLMKHMFLRA